MPTKKERITDLETQVSRLTDIVILTDIVTYLSERLMLTENILDILDDLGDIVGDIDQSKVPGRVKDLGWHWSDRIDKLED